MNKLVFLFLLFSFPLIGQNGISGKVLSHENKEPIVGASVFINNTTIGTITDEEGNFKLSRLSHGKHELIVSIMGYEKYATIIESPSAGIQTIYLYQKTNQLSEVVIKAFDKNGWEKWGPLFLETFLGTTSNGEKAKLKNKNDIRFRHNKETNKLEVYALKPLLIDSKALGYSLEYHLELFEIDFGKNTNTYAGYPFFKENKKVSKAKVKNREAAYNASLTRFMRSLYNNTVQADGYLIRKMVEVKNLEKERVRALQNQYRLKEINTDGKLISVSLPVYPPEIYTADSLKYFDKVLAQPNATFSLYKDTLAVSQLIKTDSNQVHYLYFEDYLHVVNSHFKEDKKYLEFLRQNRNPEFQTSMLILINEEPLEIQENGNYFPPLNLFSGDYWGWCNKVGDLLPLDYKPNSSTP